MKSFDLSLHLVTNRSMSYRSLSLGKPLEEIVEQAVQGGVTMVQLREKNCSTREFFDIAVRLKAILKGYNIPLIISDRLDIAIAIDADGLHLDQQDLPYLVARKIFGNDKIIGLTVENLDQIEEANSFDVDYIAVAPIFYTTSIIDATSAFGLKGLMKAVSISKHPILAGGGINKYNLEDIAKTGISGVAIASAIVSSKDPLKSARELKFNFT